MSSEETTVKLPKVVIKGELEYRQIQTRLGVPRTVYFQRAIIQLDDEVSCRVDIPVERPEEALSVGTVRLWNVMADIEPGRYGSLALSRRFTLINPESVAKQQAPRVIKAA